VSEFAHLFGPGPKLFDGNAATLSHLSTLYSDDPNVRSRVLNEYATHFGLDAPTLMRQLELAPAPASDVSLSAALREFSQNVQTEATRADMQIRTASAFPSVLLHHGTSSIAIATLLSAAPTAVALFRTACGTAIAVRTRATDTECGAANVVARQQTAIVSAYRGGNLFVNPSRVEGDGASKLLALFRSIVDAPMRGAFQRRGVWWLAVAHCVNRNPRTTVRQIRRPRWGRLSRSARSFNRSAAALQASIGRSAASSMSTANALCRRPLSATATF
jgi:hypothetical protein